MLVRIIEFETMRMVNTNERFGKLGWYAQRSRNFKCELHPGFSHCAMLLNAQCSGSLVLPRT